MTAVTSRAVVVLTCDVEGCDGTLTVEVDPERPTVKARERARAVGWSEFRGVAEGGGRPRRDHCERH